MPKKISKDIPLLELTLRKYEKPYTSSKRESIRKLCLSVGLLQPGDSRDIIVDILQVLLNNRKRKVLMNSEEIRAKVISNRKKLKLSSNGAASSNIRRQVKRLKGLYLIESIKNQYRVTEFEEPISIFDKHIKNFYLKNILERVEEHFRAVN